MVTYNTLIDVYGKAGQWEEALGVLSRMQREGCAPVTRTYNTLMIACNTSAQWQVRCAACACAACGCGCVCACAEGPLRPCCCVRLLAPYPCPNPCLPLQFPFTHPRKHSLNTPTTTTHPRTHHAPHPPTPAGGAACVRGDGGPGS